MKIALIKQVVYQDLYVCSHEEKRINKILFSSMGRVGPLGILSELNGDFYIVDEMPEYKETLIYKKVLPSLADSLYMLKENTLDKLPGQEFKTPGSKFSNGAFAVNLNNIDFSKYDVVISINVSVPKKIVKKYKKTLFCYMIGEANRYSHFVFFGYDVCLNQKARGLIKKKCGVIDFPYTFLKSDTLLKVMENELKRKPLNYGIYIEINSCEGRPVKRIPDVFEAIANQTSQKCIIHEQLIKENLIRIYDSKYFVKLGGREIRGNSVIESISLGTLVLIDKTKVVHHELIPEECNIKNAEDIIKTINFLEQNPSEYKRLLSKERQLLDEYIFKKPLLSIKNALEYKRRKA